SEQTRDELLKLLQSFQERLWLPHQAAMEYERNRLVVIRDQIAAYDKTLASFTKNINAVRTELSRLARHPLLDHAAVTAITDEFVNRVTELVEETRARHPALGASQEELLEDATRSALESMFEGRVGPSYSGTANEEVIAEATRRLDAQMPPGYLDGEKP